MRGSTGQIWGFLLAFMIGMAITVAVLGYLFVQEDGEPLGKGGDAAADEPF